MQFYFSPFTAFNHALLNLLFPSFNDILGSPIVSQSLFNIKNFSLDDFKISILPSVHSLSLSGRELGMETSGLSFSIPLSFAHLPLAFPGMGRKRNYRNRSKVLLTAAVVNSMLCSYVMLIAINAPKSFSIGHSTAIPFPKISSLRWDMDHTLSIKLNAFLDVPMNHQKRARLCPNKKKL